MENRINEIENKIVRIELKLETHDAHIDNLTEAIEKLSNTIEEQKDIQNKVKYWIQAAIFILVAQQSGLLPLLQKMVGLS